MDPEDLALLRRVEPPFSPLRMFVCTFEAELDNICETHRALIAALEPAGAVKVLNCNYGHKAQPGFERFLKGAPARPEPAAAPPPGRAPPNAAAGLAPAHVRQRKLQGDGSCFNSALEAIVIPGPGDDPPPAVRALLATNPDKHYAVKSFPTTGKTQVPGVLSLGLEDGAFVARLWARYLTLAGVGARPGAPVRVVAERPIMQNFKFHLERRDPRVILNLGRLVGYLEDLGGAAKGSLPYPVREIKHAQDNQNISFKFQVAPPKKVRVNVFFRGKVNILGAASPESAQRIYDFLSGLLRENWETFVVIQPLSDRERAARRRAREEGGAGGRAAPPRSPPAPDLAVAPEHLLGDREVDDLLRAGGGGAAAGPAAAFDLEKVLALAGCFERGEFGGGGRRLDNPAFDEVEGEDVEDDEEDALDGDAV